MSERDPKKGDVVLLPCVVIEPPGEEGWMTVVFDRSNSTNHERRTEVEVHLSRIIVPELEIFAERRAVQQPLFGESAA